MDNAFPKTKGMLVEISNDTLRGLVESLLDYPTFRVVNAGPNHHNYEGGLAQHTYEVASLCLGLYSAFEVKDKLSKDLLIAGALLHDVGRAFMDSKDYYSGVGAAHSIIGAYEVNKACNTFGLTEKQTQQLVNLVTEHGVNAYTTPMKFTTRESFIVHYADILSASVWGHEMPGFCDDTRWEKIELSAF